MLSTMQDVPLTVGRILQHGSTVHGDARVATWVGDGARYRSFTEVGARAAQFAHALRDLGVHGDERVATLMWNNSEHLEAYLAVPAMGAVLHTLNLRLPPEQLVWVVNHAGDHVLLVDDTVLPLLGGVLGELRTVQHIVVSGSGDRSSLDQALQALPVGTRPQVHDYEQLLDGRPTSYPWVEDIDERSAAAICYTSGTTGHPKGVVYSHRSIYLHSMQVNMGESFGTTWRDRMMPVVPMFHVNAWGIPHAAFMSGVSLLMPDRFMKPAPLAEMITSERPTRAAAVPTIWAGLLAELDAHAEENAWDISSLDKVVIGGAACPPSLMRGYQERYGVEVVHAWGMTETSPLGSVALPPGGLTAEQEWPYRLTQGRIPAGVQARLVGPQGRVLEHDGSSTGELEVRGPWIAGAYYTGVDGTPDPEADEHFHDGWLRTGDVGTITPDGYLTLTDRAKDVVKSGGEWISSMELENQLVGHPGVAEAAVIAVPDEKWGERPLAAVVFHTSESTELPDFSALRAYLAERCARWQLPERWTRLEEVPKTSVGKFDKKTLRARLEHGELDVTTL